MTEVISSPPRRLPPPIRKRYRRDVTFFCVDFFLFICFDILLSRRILLVLLWQSCVLCLKTANQKALLRSCLLLRTKALNIVILCSPRHFRRCLVRSLVRRQIVSYPTSYPTPAGWQSSVLFRTCVVNRLATAR